MKPASHPHVTFKKVAAPPPSTSSTFTGLSSFCNTYIREVVCIVITVVVAAVILGLYGGGVFTSSSSSSSAAVTSSTGSGGGTQCTVTPSVSSAVTGGMTNYFPLQGSYANLWTPAATLTLQGTTSCASFSSPSPTTTPLAWTQTCPNINAASLSLPNNPESGNFSQCVYFYATAFPAQDWFIFSCIGIVSGTVDCLELWYSTNPDINVRINGAVSTDSYGVTLGLHNWYHICVAYMFTSTSQVWTYLDGALLATQTMTHQTSNYGSPVLAGEGGADDYQGFPTVGLFANWRTYNITISAATVAAIYEADTPLCS